MALKADQLSGAFFFLFGLGMYFLVNPRFIESVDGANLAPATLPNAVSIVIAICGALLLVKPTAHSTYDVRSIALTAVYVALLFVGIYTMSLFGFEYVAPFLALAIMGVMGERRIVWLVLGTVGMPALIWFLVVHVLGRALP